VEVNLPSPKAQMTEEPRAGLESRGDPAGLVAGGRGGSWLLYSLCQRLEGHLALFASDDLLG